jgi:hypothetical protein
VPLRPELVLRAVPLLEREALVRSPGLVLRAVAPLDREALVRPPVAAFERDAVSEALVERLPDEEPLEFPLALALAPGLLDEPRLLSALREVGSVAILSSLSIETACMQGRATPPERAPICMQAFRVCAGAAPRHLPIVVNGTAGAPCSGRRPRRREAA